MNGHGSIIQVVKDYNNPTEDWKNKIWYIHIKEYYPAKITIIC